MIRDKWIVGFRNKLTSLAWECDSCAAIEGSRLTETERKDLREMLAKAISYVDKRIMK